MLAVINITFPIFALIALGHVMTRRGWFVPQEMSTLGHFTINVALPALIFNAMVSRPLAEVVNPGYLLTYALATVLTMALAGLALKIAGFRARRCTVGMLGVCCSNSGYMGYPILMLAYPDLAGTVLTMQVVIENFLSIPLGLMAVESTTPRVRAEPLRLLVQILGGVLRRPMVQAVILGLIVNLSGIHLPQAVGHMVSILAVSTSAVALFYIGGTLVGVPHERGDGLFVGLVVSVKLIAMPLIAFGLSAALPHLGMPAVAAVLAVPLLISAAMPTMGIFPILAQDYGEGGVAAVTLLVATVVSFFTISALLALVHSPAL